MPIGSLIDGWYDPGTVKDASTVIPASDPMAPPVGGIVAWFRNANRVGRAAVEKNPVGIAPPKIGTSITFWYDPIVIAILAGEF